MKPHQHPFFITEPYAVTYRGVHSVRFHGTIYLREDAAQRGVEAVELLVHHDGYERRVLLPWDSLANSMPIDVLVQYGGAVDFTEIEVALVYCGGGRSEPQFFQAPREVRVYLPYRAANPTLNGDPSHGMS